MSNFKLTALASCALLAACASNMGSMGGSAMETHDWVYGVRYAGGRLVDNGNADIWVEQATVQTFIPENPSHPPIVMVPGLGLSGTMYTTTTDGERKGWAQLFAEAGYPVYVYDMPEYSTSGGFDVTMLTSVLGPLQANQANFGNPYVSEDTACIEPAAAAAGGMGGGGMGGAAGPVCPEPLPMDVSTPSFSIYGGANLRAWVGLEDGEPWSGSKFPMDDYAMAQFEKSFPYRWNDNRVEGGDIAPITGNAEAEALVHLFEDEIGEPFIIMTHSMGSTVVPALLQSRPDVVRAVIGYEPAGLVNQNSLEERAEQLKDKPYLSLYGDNVQARGHGGRYDLNLVALVPAVQAAGGVAGAIDLPKLGITGNSHMMAQDTNNVEIAELVIEWLNENVE